MVVVQYGEGFLSNAALSVYFDYFYANSNVSEIFEISPNYIPEGVEGEDYVFVYKKNSNELGFLFTDPRTPASVIENAVWCLLGQTEKCEGGQGGTNQGPHGGNGLGLLNCKTYLPDFLCEQTWLWWALGGFSAYKTFNAPTKMGQIGFGVAALYCFNTATDGKLLEKK